MKKIFVVMLATLFCGSVFAQTQKSYCQIVGTAKGLKQNEVTVAIDFGQEDAMRKNALGGSAHRNRLVDENGKPMLFNSMVDAMNFMAGLGWKFEAAYVISMPNPMGGAQHVYHWLLSKDITAGDNAVEGLKTQGQYKQENPAN